MCWARFKDSEIIIAAGTIARLANSQVRELRMDGVTLLWTARADVSDMIKLASIYVDNSQHDFWQQLYRIEVGVSEHHPEVRSVAHGQS